MKGIRLTLFELRAKRLRAGLSPEDLGRRLGLNGKTIRAIEEGQLKRVPNINTLKRLADYLEVDIVALAGEFEDLVEKRESVA